MRKLRTEAKFQGILERLGWKCCEDVVAHCQDVTVGDFAQGRQTGRQLWSEDGGRIKHLIDFPHHLNATFLITIEEERTLWKMVERLGCLHPLTSAVKAELNSYRLLRESGLPVPEIVASNDHCTCLLPNGGMLICQIPSGCLLRQFLANEFDATARQDAVHAGERALGKLVKSGLYCPDFLLDNIWLAADGQIYFLGLRNLTTLNNLAPEYASQHLWEIYYSQI